MGSPNGPVPGTVNGVGGYTFTATVIDGTPDSFGIIIKKLDGSTYYLTSVIPLAGGNLVNAVQ